MSSSASPTPRPVPISRWPLSFLPGPTGSAGDFPYPPQAAARRRFPGRCPKRSTGLRLARRSPAGSARLILTPTCALSRSRRKRWRGFPTRNSAPATPRSIKFNGRDNTRLRRTRSGDLRQRGWAVGFFSDLRPCRPGHPPPARQARLARPRDPAPYRLGHWHRRCRTSLVAAAGRDGDTADRAAVLVALHSFTPVFKGVARPWHAAVLYNRDARLALPLFELLNAEDGLVVGNNEPYRVTDLTDFTVPVHGERRGLPHVEIEIRQDQITDSAGQAAWAERLARVLPAAYAEFLCR